MEPIGIRLPDETYGYDIPDIVEFAKHAEDHDYHSVWAAELQGPNGFMMLGQIANETSDIGLGTGIVNVYSRTPALLAMSVATLDQLSDGRALLGLAASSKVKAVTEAWSNGDREEAANRVSDELLNEVAIGGTPEGGREKLREYRDLDADIPVIYPPKAPHETIETTIAELSSY